MADETWAVRASSMTPFPCYPAGLLGEPLSSLHLWRIVLNLTVVSQSATRITVSWIPPSGVVGYRFFRDDKPVSTSYDPLKSQATFGIPDLLPHTYRVQPMTDLEPGTVSVNQPAPPAPPAPAPSPIVTPLLFGYFGDGTINGEIKDDSWNWKSPHVTLLPGGGPNGRNAVRLVGDDSMTFPNQGSYVRIHGEGFKGGDPSWFKTGNTIWLARSQRVPSGYGNTYQVTADELHGDNGTGPAPLNQTFTRGHNWEWIIRGSNYPGPTGGAWSFAQNVFGGWYGHATYGGQYYRHAYDFVGGNKPVVDDEWVHWRAGWHLDPNEDPATTSGWFELSMRTDEMTSWLNVVPRKTGIPTTYGDFSGDGFSIYPYMSLYYSVGGGQQNAIDYAVGAYWPSYDELAAWQDHELGFA